MNLSEPSISAAARLELQVGVPKVGRDLPGRWARRRFQNRKSRTTGGGSNNQYSEFYESSELMNLVKLELMNLVNLYIESS